MARQSANSLLNSLKGKIWLATSGLAFFICTFGLVSYLLVSLLVSETFYAVFIPFLFLGFAVMVFGWWLSNEVVSPIEKVSLLAKSLERGVAVSLPRTSGSTETDELLQTLYRNNQQLQNLVGLMDKVANGDLDVALTPLENSDRLSNSFQKLLAKVTDSIQAKQDLEKLQAAVGYITEEVSRVRNGNFDIEIKSDFVETKEISETIKYLIHHLRELIAQIRGDAKHAQISAAEAKKTLQTVIYTDEIRINELGQAALALKQIPNNVQKISEELSVSAVSANQSIEKARNGTLAAQENLNAVSGLRKQVQESVKRIGRLSERSREIGKVAKTVEDLAHRTNMIALNASIQAAELGTKGRGFAIIAEEVERLASRAENTNKQISSFSKTISAEIGEVEHSLQATVGEAAGLSKFAVETGNSLGELEKYVRQFLNLQTKLISYSSGQSADTEKAFQTFVKSISETENTVIHLKESEAKLAQLASSMEHLQLSVADFKLSPASIVETPKISDFSQPLIQIFEEKI
ncbi:MAG: methyl-accepting chemotaxis protein [Pyrinomonadaceae bacterium]